MPITNKKNIYFFSDLHLGFPDAKKSRVREKKLTRLLREIKPRAKEVWFLGDIFDFWWEYKKVIPRGFVRFMGTIADFSDAGIPVHFLPGNHDIWVKNYLTEELGMTIHHQPVETIWGNHSFFLAHGDGLGPGEKKYKLLKKLFTNKRLQWLFSRLHPNLALGIAHKWSQSSRQKHSYTEFTGRNKEHLILYAEEKLLREDFDYFIFGHRHIPMHIDLKKNAELINLGEWLHEYTYAFFDGEKIKLMTYKNNKEENFSNDIH
ncbi:MAG: UDP-2,3-diacylglucosamine diphosphatase [Bacteroidota bacterium]|nr:UDP-2,3-diacylglucosamine diphosphatase [Bacteroidota bacterium]